MLNMLPKFELVPISRYFIMLPEARRPSRIPRWSTRRLRSLQNDVGGITCHVGGGHHRNPDIGGVQRRARR